MESRFKGLYDTLPVFVQNSILTGFSALLDRERYGGRFTSFKSFLDNSQWYSAAQLKDYQESQLVKLMAYAYDHVPYYRRVMDERGLKPSDLQSLTDLKKLPVLTKRDIKANFVELLSDEFNLRSVKKGHTSGTTGSPLEICYSDSLIHINYAMLDRQYTWASVRMKRFGDRVAVVRGNVIVPLQQVKPPFWRYNYLHNQLLLSSFHLSPQNLPFYIDILARYSPKALDGYPSTVYILAKYLKNIGRKLKLHAVFTSSETLFDFQRETIEESFDCKVFDYFGSAERVLFSAECDHHRGHHIADEYGITEFLDADHKPLGPGKMGALVATSLHNYAMPMIRYITNDMSSLKAEPCSCGRSLPLLEDVTTKAEDLLTLRDGRLISPSVLTHPFKPLTSIIESQIIQEDLDRVCIKLVASSEFSSQDEQSLIHGLKERLGEEVDVRVEKVEALERTRTGKFKWVISKVRLGI
jgi:phenylacetate-CoA ligase